MRWGILPALMAGFVAYQMDTPVSDDEPKRKMAARAVGRFSVWAMVLLKTSAGAVRSELARS